MGNNLQKLFVEESSISESNIWLRIRLTGSVSPSKDAIPEHNSGSPFSPSSPSSPFSPCSPYWHHGVSPFSPQSPGSPSSPHEHSPHESWDVNNPEKYPSIFLPEKMVIFYSNSSELKQSLNTSGKIIINTKHVISIEKILIDRVCSRRIENEGKKDFRVTIPNEIPQITQPDQELLFPVSVENGIGPYRFSLINQPTDLYITKDGWIRGFIDASEWPETGFRDFSILVLAEDSSTPKNNAGIEFRYRLNSIGEVSPSFQNIEYQALSERVAEDESDSMPSFFLPEDKIIFYSNISELVQVLAEQKPGDREKVIVNSENVVSIEKVEVEKSYEQEIIHEDIRIGSRFSELNYDFPLRLSILKDTLVPSSSKAEVLFQVKATGGIQPYKFTLSNQPTDLYITKDGWIRGFVDKSEIPPTGYKDYFLVVSVEDNSLPKKTSGLEIQYRLHSEDQYEVIPSYNIVEANTQELPVERPYRAKNLIPNNIEKLRDEFDSILNGKKKTWLKIKLVSAVEGVEACWQDYKPKCYINLISNTTVPNVVPSVHYFIQGKTIFMKGILDFTGPPVGAIDLSISLPNNVKVENLSSANKFSIVGNSVFFDSSLGLIGVWRGGIRLPLPTENMGRISFRAQTAISSIAGVNPNVPFTWENGDKLEFDFFMKIQ